MSLYRGRFAPTPSGPLHFGSLFAAVVSYLDAKAHRGEWLVRIEDIDPPRIQPGASTEILKSLAAHGLEWDQSETYQSDHTDRYLDNLSTLTAEGRLYGCECSRKQLSSFTIYPGHCRTKTVPFEHAALRFRVSSIEDGYTDVFQGPQSANLETRFGDVVVRRRDHLFSYQLAVVSDDIAQQISHVIRGVDLIDSVFWQRDLIRALGAEMPIYGHFPVIYARNAQQKLSKQNKATAIDNRQASQTLHQVFQRLNLNVDITQPEHMLKEAVSLWQRSGLAKKQVIYI